MSLSATVVGFDDFLADVTEAGIQAEPLVRAGLQNSATQTQRNIRDRAPHVTGALQGSILTQISYPTATVTANAPYAQFIEDGTRPHTIQPKSKKALYWSGAFSPVKSVQHPGTKANPFFSTGVDASADYISDQFLRIAERLVEIMAGK